jgi:hypothetical protein
MADKQPRKGASPILTAAIVAAIVLFAVIVFMVVSQPIDDADEGPPPELGPDMGQVAPPRQLASPDGLVQPAQLTTPPAASIGDFAYEDESLSFKVKMPAGSPTDPVRRWLLADAESYLSSTKPNARADLERMKRAGAPPQQWQISITWSYTAKAGSLVSLLGVSEEYTGGAHPVQHFDTIIANPQTGERLTMPDVLLRERSPSPAMTIGICEALKAAKMKRIGSATIMDDPIVCVGGNANAKTADAQIALAPSSEPGKFGGVYAYYEPYDVGPYAEGGYRLTVQQGVFAEDIRAQYRNLFAGEAPVVPTDRF